MVAALTIHTAVIGVPRHSSSSRIALILLLLSLHGKHHEEVVADGLNSTCATLLLRVGRDHARVLDTLGRVVFRISRLRVHVVQGGSMCTSSPKQY